MSTPAFKSRDDLLQEWIRRVVSYTDKLSWFGGNSVTRALGKATAAAAENAYQLYVALVRRNSVLNADGDELDGAAAERGVQRLGTSPAKVLVVFQPFTANVTAITIGATDLIEVDDSSGFDVAMPIRIRNGDGTTTETATVIAITTATGPNGLDEIEVATLGNAYTPATDDVDLLARITIAEGTELTSEQGVNFVTLEEVTTGEANAVLDGEGSFVGLLDKAWCEADTPGEVGNIEPYTISGFVSGTPDGIVQAYNPERGSGGEDTETDYALKVRAIRQGSMANQETADWIERTAQAGDSNVLRAIRTDEFALGSMFAQVLHRNGTGFTTQELANLNDYVEQRVRSNLGVTFANVTLTSVEITATITLENDYTLEGVWKDYSNRVATYLDHRKWDWGDDVDWQELYAILINTPGVATADPTLFSPTSDVSVSEFSLPVLTSVALTDSATGDAQNASFAVSF